MGKLSIILAAAVIATAQDLGSLKTVSIPQPPEIEKFVTSQNMLVALGKALFWDMQVGSDGRMACATCHFHAGADHRNRNQLVNPIGGFPVNHALTLDDFPFRILADPNNNRSDALRDSAAIVGSAGLFRRMFVDIAAGSAPEDGFDSADAPAFSLNGIATRRVTGRNSPTVINAVFYVRNFWDGRASNIFTGQTPFGDSDPRPNLLVMRDGRLTAEQVRVENASLASQAVGPAVNNVEMSYEGRSWPKIGKKMLALRPLALQTISPDDSVLGSLVDPSGRGLVQPLTYLSLVQAAFQPEFWNSTQLVDAAGRPLNRTASAAAATDEFTQAEFNFAVLGSRRSGIRVDTGLHRLALRSIFRRRYPGPYTRRADRLAPFPDQRRLHGLSRRAGIHDGIVHRPRAPGPGGPATQWRGHRYRLLPRRSPANRRRCRRGGR